MSIVKALLNKISKIEHGFKHIIDAGQVILRDGSLDHFQLAENFIEYKQSYQIRMLGTYLLGDLAVTNIKALQVLEKVVSKDENWRVQEMLGKSFDAYCKNKGYEKALAKIEFWVKHKNSNIARAVTEGLRIWTGRDFFRENPKTAIELISSNKGTESLYLRKSIGNALRDIKKSFPQEINEEISKWDKKDNKVAFIVNLINK